MAPATDRLYSAIMEGKITHDGDERMVKHFNQAVAKDTHMGALISKDKKGGSRKIDSAVAAIVAMDRAAHHSAKPGRTRSFAS